MSFDFFALLAQDAAASPGSPASFLWVFVAIFILYMFLIQRPQSREKQERQNALNGLKKGDDVVTIGGLIAKVESIDKARKRVTLATDKNSRLTFLLSAVDRVLTKDDQKAGEEPAAETEKKK